MHVLLVENDDLIHSYLAEAMMEAEFEVVEARQQLNIPVRLPPSSSTAVPFTVLTTVRNIGPQIVAALEIGSLT